MSMPSLTPGVRNAVPDALVVIDASLVVKAILPNPETARCQAVLAHLQAQRLVAPAVWVDEIASLLARAVHSGQMTVQEGEEALHQAMALGVQIILPDETQARLAYRQALQSNLASTYDSFYLVAAEGLAAEFWTADQRLIQSFLENKPAGMHFIDEIEI